MKVITINSNRLGKICKIIREGTWVREFISIDLAHSFDIFELDGQQYKIYRDGSFYRR